MSAETDDFLERHGDAIENALLKKQIAELEINGKLIQMGCFPHSGEWIRETQPDGTVKLRYPPNRGYDDAKDEVDRMLDDDRWKFSLWEAKQYFATRWLFLGYVSIAVVGFCVINSPWQRTLIGSVLIIVLFTYLKQYGTGNKNPIARLRSYIRGHLQNQARGQARDGSVEARPQPQAVDGRPGD